MNYYLNLLTFMLLIILVSLVKPTCYAQDQRIADSLESIFQKQDVADSLLPQLLHGITVNQTNPDKRLSYADLLEKTTSKSDDSQWPMKINFIRGLANMEKGNLKVALESFLNSLKVARKLKDENWIGMIYIQMSAIYEYSNNYKLAFSYIRKAIEIFEKLKSQNHPKATSNLATATLTLGNRFMTTGNYDSASVKFDESILVYKKLNDAQGLAYALGSKGVLLAKQNLILRAEEYVMEAKEILNTFHDLEPIVYYNNNLSEAYLINGDYKKALDFLEESLIISLESNIKSEIAETYLKLSVVQERLGNSALALENFKTHILYRDSLRNIESIQELANMRSDFEIEQKQSEVDILNLEKKQQQQIGFGLLLVLLLSAALAFTQYRNAKLRKRTNQELTALNQTKDKFFSIISHDLRGPVSAFQGISGIIRMYLKKQRYEKLEEMTDEIDGSVRSMSNLLDNLLNWAVQQQGQVPFKPEYLSVDDMVMEVIQTFQTSALTKKVNLTHDVSPALRLWADKNTLSTVIRNLVSNALKFTPEGGEINILAFLKDESCVLKISDTGLGMPKDQVQNLFYTHGEINSTRGTAGEKGLGLGVQLVKDFVKMNKGFIDVQSKPKNGTTITVLIPVERDLSISA